MTSPQDPNPSTPPVKPLPSGESQTGVVRKVAETPENSPVLEHRAAVPEAAAPDADASKPMPALAAEAPAPAPSVTPPQAVPVATPTPRPLQEISKVPIPVRMNQLQTDHQRLRDELQALEDALKSPPN